MNLIYGLDTTYNRSTFPAAVCNEASFRRLKFNTTCDMSMLKTALTPQQIQTWLLYFVHSEIYLVCNKEGTQLIHSEVHMLCKLKRKKATGPRETVSSTKAARLIYEYSSPRLLPVSGSRLTTLLDTLQPVPVGPHLIVDVVALKVVLVRRQESDKT